jgi:hypothetical protein
MFTPLHTFPTFSSLPLLPIPPVKKNSTLLFSSFVNGKYDILAYLRLLHGKFHCDISIYIYVNQN